MKMYNLSNILLFVMSFLAAAIYLLQHLGIGLPLWINCYTNDFLCLPIVLGYEQLFFRWLTGKRNYTFSLPLILSMAAYYSLYFEYYLPQINERYTADFIDVILYFSGALCFYLLNLAFFQSQYFQLFTRKNN